MILTTLATVQEELGITEDITRLIEQASARIVAYCGREFHFETGTVEYLRAAERQFLVPDREPIVSITEIRIKDTVIPASEYSVRGRMIFRRDGWGPMAAEVKITFDSGWVTPEQEALNPTLTRTLPHDVEDACIGLVTHLYRNKGQDPAVTGEKVGDAQQAYEMAGMPARIAELLRPYRWI